MIDAFVDAIDRGDLGFDGVVPEATGRPPYHPSVLLKLYIYGYLNRLRWVLPSPCRRSARVSASRSTPDTVNIVHI